MTDIEVEFEDTKKGIKLRLKGAPDVVESYLQKYGYDSAMKEASNRQSEATQPTTIVDQTTAQKETISDIPEKPKAESLSQYVTMLMYGSWGAPGRTSTEIQTVAGAHGIALNMSTLSGILNALTKSAKLRRARQAGEARWRYYPPLSVVTGRA